MKKTIRTNHHLEVLADPHSLILVDDDRRDAVMRDILQDIKRQIHRHVDDVYQVTLKWDTSCECSHCGCTWEELSSEEAADPRARLDDHSIQGEPVCCEKAVNEFRTGRDIPPCST